MEQVTALRFILRQPSPAWLHFSIEELQVFPPAQKVTPPQHMGVPRDAWGTVPWGGRRAGAVPLYVHP